MPSRPRVPRTRDPSDAGLDAYARAVAGVCPYLTPSIRSGQTRWAYHRIAAEASNSDVEAVLFAAGVRSAELVRGRAATGRRLACEVTAVDWPGSAGQSRAAVLDWPHWALKHLYAQAGIMVGKFGPGLPDRGRSGRTVPAPPVLVLAVRTAVRERDPRLLAGTPGLARVIARAEDDGRDVYGVVPGVPSGTEPALAWPQVRRWAAALPPRTRGDDRR